jgi:hypothetical protein
VGGDSEVGRGVSAGRGLRRARRLGLPAVLLSLAALLWPAPSHSSPGLSSPESRNRSDTADRLIFRGAQIQYSPDSSGQTAGTGLRAEDNGRVIAALDTLPELAGPVRITAHLVIHPIPKDPESVYDRWDRAGNVRLSLPSMPDLELVKLVTAYGGETSYDLDVSQLAPLLRGTRLFKGFIDTWVTPAWRIDFSLRFRPDSTVQNPVWVRSVLYEESFTAKDPGEQGKTVSVEIPAGPSRVVLYYLVSGHCTDGTDADEFVSKDNVISVDGRVVYRFRPWRDDCRQFRDRNPYCRRWSDGSWSCDYSRSGWCPSDLVRPVQVDLTDHLTPGVHTMRFLIETIRPVDAKGQFGYWRVSGYLTGWER